MKLYGQLEGAQFENLAADPTTGLARGRFYYNTALGTVRYYTGTGWTSFGSPSSAVNGSRTSPKLITAVGGITPLQVADETQFIAGNGAAITVTANPQIGAGNAVGQTLELIGRDATNTVLIQDGTGLDLNGSWLASLGSILGLRWDGANWCERYRR